MTEHPKRSTKHPEDQPGDKNLLIASALNLTITIAELIGGVLSNSLALLSDAVHNLGDTIAVAIAYIANRIGRKKSTSKKTFGYKRIEILAALFNAVVLVVIIVFLFREAWIRLNNPEPIKGMIMFIVSVTGLLANLFAVLLLRKESGKNINIRAAYLHLLGDTISSVAVIIGSLFIVFFQIYWIDPLITVFIGLYILKETFAILRETVDILMQGTPKGLDLDEVINALEQFHSIDDVHHVHAWNLNDSQIHFECHVNLKNDLQVSESTLILQQIGDHLKKYFHIDHITIQFEHQRCPDKNGYNKPC